MLKTRGKIFVDKKVVLNVAWLRIPFFLLVCRSRGTSVPAHRTPLHRKYKPTVENGRKNEGSRWRHRSFKNTWANGHSLMSHQNQPKTAPWRSPSRQMKWLPKLFHTSNMETLGQNCKTWSHIGSPACKQNMDA